MLIVESTADVPTQALGAIVAIGNFDGVHRGHQALLAAAKDAAQRRGRPHGVLTFQPHPAKVLAPDLAPPLLLRPDERRAELARFGAEIMVELPFDRAFAAQSPRAFIDHVLGGALDVGGVVVGPDFSFGHKGAGSVDDLRQGLALAQATVTVVDAIKEGSLVCSSTKVREFVSAGRVEAAGRLLGRPYFLEGEVVRGDGRGRGLGFPTANIDAGRELLPEVGVYVGEVILDDGRRIGAVTNVGLRPTFQGEGVRVEAHLFDFDESLYGRRVRHELFARLRGEQRFADRDALADQIEVDRKAARAYLERRSGAW